MGVMDTIAKIRATDMDRKAVGFDAVAQRVGSIASRVDAMASASDQRKKQKARSTAKRK